MRKYILKRVALLLFTFFIIVTVSFVLIRMLPRELPSDKALADIMLDRWEALGYGKPILVQYLIYLKGIVTAWDFGTSWYVEFRAPVWDLLIERLPPTITVNLFALLISIPIGILLGVLASLKRGKPTDLIISLGVMIFVSVPSYVYAFVVQYVLGYELGWFPLTVYPLSIAGGWLTPKMLYSMFPAILALSFGEVAGLARFTRAEMCEALEAEHMVFSRAKGLRRSYAIRHHALRNALVPILPTIVASVIGVMAGSVIIEEIFSIPGVGQLYIRAINLGDYDVFMMNTVFYTFLGLLSGLAVDLSYGFIDPRIRVGEA
ncbi:MAG: ABC transporter permease [Clostridia bacterium]|nr:ABC transporter permease [Clostridia bacterium]